MVTASLFPHEADAVISACGRYRYSLTRTWDDSLPRVCFVMLNPSTADAGQDDPTLRRCKAFARSWGYGSIEIVNLFGLRATNPKALYDAAEPVGPENDGYIDAAVGRAARVVVAWGAHGAYQNRGRAVFSRIGEAWHLNKTRNGHPGHPLYVSARAKLVRFSGDTL